MGASSVNPQTKRHPLWLRCHQHGWRLGGGFAQTTYRLDAVPIPMRVDAGQPHKAEWWLKFDTLSHTELNRFLTSLNIVTLTIQSGLGKTPRQDT